MTTPDRPRLKKMWLTIIDDRTTVICLRAAGQVVDTDADFDTLAGDYFAPPGHIHCRSVAIPVIEEVVAAQLADADAELARRGYPQPGRLPPPPRVDAPHQIMRPRPGWVPTPERRWHAPTGLVTAAHRDELMVWLPEMMRLYRRRQGVPDPFADPIATGVAQRQGFTGTPRLVSPGELAGVVDTQDVPRLWRGLDAERAEQLATGDTVRLGPGILGAGLYFTVDEDTAARFAGPRGVVVAGTVSPQARIITWAELEALVKATRDSLSPSQARRLSPLLADPGRFAAAMGYDAVILPDGDYLVLNRTALILVWGEAL